MRKLYINKHEGGLRIVGRAVTTRTMPQVSLHYVHDPIIAPQARPRLYLVEGDVKVCSR